MKIEKKKKKKKTFNYSFRLRALQEKEKCNDNEHTQKEFDVCKRKAEAAIAKAAALDERIKTLGQEKEFLESTLRINFLEYDYSIKYQTLFALIIFTQFMRFPKGD